MDLPRPAVMTDILEEHLEEMSFLWELREGMLRDLESTPDDLASTQARIEAHRDGLLVGGGRSADLAFAALAGDDPWLAAAGADVLLHLGPPELREAVADRLPSLPPESQDAVRRVLRRSPIGGAEGRLRRLVKEGPPLARAVALDVLAYQRRYPEDRIDDLVADPSPLVRRIALEAAGRARLGLDGKMLETALRDDSPSVRRTALESAARWPLPELPRICRHAAKTAAVPEAIAFLGRFAGSEDEAFLARALRDPALAPAALAALGAAGRPEGVPRILEAMGNPALRRAAGEAFVMLTGADIASREEDESDGAALPDPEKARAFWREHGANFTAVVRPDKRDL